MPPTPLASGPKVRLSSNELAANSTRLRRTGDPLDASYTSPVSQAGESAAHIDDSTPSPIAPRPKPTSPPYSLVVGIACGLLILRVGWGPLRDGDLYWHILAGQELAEGTPADSLGLDWTYAAGDLPWTSTQWLSELLFYWLHSAGSWSSLAAFRVVTAAIAIAVLAFTTLKGRPVSLAGFPFLLAAGAVALISQERPQQFTLIGAACLSGVLVRGLGPGLLPRWWIVLPATAIWANLHGGWILVPAILGMTTIGRLLDHGWRDTCGRSAALMSVAALGLGVLTPARVDGITATLRFSRATSNLVEWGSTVPMSAAGFVTVLMLMLIAVAWSRPGKVPRSEVFSVLILLMFAWTAWRNMTPGVVLLAPLIAESLTRAFPQLAHRQEPVWSKRAGVAAAGIMTLAALGSIPGRAHLPTEQNPVELARRIAELEPGQHVLNDYNVAGLVLYFGGEGTRVAIDGRADRYGAEYINSHILLNDLKGNWEQRLKELAPTSALIKTDTALAFYLVTEKGWEVVDVDGEYSLMVAPTPSAEAGEGP